MEESKTNLKFLISAVTGAFVLFTFVFFLCFANKVNAANAANAVKVEKSNWIKSIRIWPSPEATRVVFDLSKSVKYKILTLTNPNRVVIDFEDVNFNVKIDELKLTKTRIKKIRHGIQRNKNLRIVLETEENFVPNSFILKPNERYGHRLVLDLESSEKQEILALFDMDVIEDNVDLDVGIGAGNLAAKIFTKPATAIKKLVPVTNFSKKPGSLSRLRATSKLSSTSKHKQLKKQQLQREKTSTVPKIVALKQQKSKTKPKSKILSLQKLNKPKPQDFIVAIDCGHGGEDPGAVGKFGTKEKTVVLAIGRELKKLINRQSNMRAFLTRNGDYYVGLRQRVLRARRRKADLFVSIHADAFKDRSAKGASVFVVSNRGASSEAARWLARKENRSDFVGGINLSRKKDKQLASALLDMSQSVSKADSLKAAKHLLKSLGGIAPLHRGHIVEKASFAVLKAPDIPSVLIETGFISNPKTEKKLRTKSYQRKLALAIMRGIKTYCVNKKKFNL